MRAATIHQILTKAAAVIWVILLSFGLTSPAAAQTATIDWETGNFPNLNGVPNPSTVTGSDGTTATVSFNTVRSGWGSFNASYGDFLSYYNGSIGGADRPLLLNFDNSSYDPDDKVTTDFTLSRTVRNLSFTLTDIDNGNFIDAVEVFYDDGSGTFVNAATNAGFWSAGSAVTRTNDATVNGWRGTANVDSSATNGDIRFNFGSTIVKRIRIVYFSYTGPRREDPGAQLAGISDFTYLAVGADLSLTKTVVGPAPAQGGNVTYRLTLSNNSASVETANNIGVRETFPSQFTFSSASGTGAFNPSTRIWSVASLAPGASVSLTITGTVSANSGTTITNTAEVIASSAVDPDSTPNNGVTSEDDYASASFVVASGRVAGVAPILNCPNGSTFFDWDASSVSWAAGSTNNSYALGTFGQIGFTVSNPGAYIDSAEFGGRSPTLQNTFTGGLSPAQRNLAVVVNQTSRSNSATIDITLPRGFEGVQFTLFDVDFAPNQFADRVTVTGSLSGTSVTPTLTNGNANYVNGNTAIGDFASDSDSGMGNVVVTFVGKVDRITISYGNHSTAPADPGQQGIGLHDIQFCRPHTTLNVTKVSHVVSDPVNGATNPKAIPGALVEYLISVTNTGKEATDPNSLIVRDNTPVDAKMCLTTFAGNSGPILFSAGSPSSGLNYSFTALNDSSDHLDFSSDGGASWAYTPSPDADGCDAAITHFRLRPTGAFAASSTFTARVRFIVK
ncbi:DUF11 domain-containing protein [Qipengyuania flava]|nr:DUF11 domain-containing protein [Qipengyuania flava]